MDKYEAWRVYGQLDREERNRIKEYFEQGLKLEGLERPGSSIICKAIVDHYMANGNWNV